MACSEEHKSLFIKRKNEVSSHPARYKNPHPAEVLAEAKGTWNWMVKVDLCDNQFMQWLATKGKYRCSTLWYSFIF